MAVHEGYQLARILTEGGAGPFPDGDIIDGREEIQEYELGV